MKKMGFLAFSDGKGVLFQVCLSGYVEIICI